MSKAKKKSELDADIITMMIIRFCESNGLLNSQCSLSDIEYYRYRRKQAIEYLGQLVYNYGDKKDKDKFVRLFSMSAKEADGLVVARIFKKRA